MDEFDEKDDIVINFNSKYKMSVVKEALRMSAAGFSTREVQKKLGVPPSTVDSWKRRAGIRNFSLVMRRKREHDWDKIRHYYENRGLSMSDISTLMGCPLSSVAAAIKTMGVSRTVPDGIRMSWARRHRKDAALAASMRMDGDSWRKIGKRLGISEYAARYLKRHPVYISVVCAKAKTPEEVAQMMDKIKKEYVESGVGIPYLSKKYGMSEVTIRKHLQSAGVMRDAKKAREMRDHNMRNGKYRRAKKK